MRANFRRTLWELMPLTVCGLLAMAGIAVLMTRQDTAAATSLPVTTEAVATDTVALPIENGATGLIGADPDPAAFDSQGLEVWWRNYQHGHRQAAAN